MEYKKDFYENKKINKNDIKIKELYIIKIFNIFIPLIFIAHFLISNIK